MGNSVLRALGFTLVLALAHASAVGAQAFEAVGARARGMGGAFVAVADDASATWWNPAGLATAGFFHAMLERGRSREPDQPASAAPRMGDRASSVAVAYPALGVSYFRTRVSSIGALAPDRQDRGTQSLVLHSFSMNAFGATFGQSFGSHLVVASTVRLARVGQAVAVGVPTDALEDRLDALEDQSVDRKTITDLDLGAMLRVGSLRFGATVKHVGEPSVSDEPGGFQKLERQGRAGVALVRGRAGVLDAWTVAVDTDLTKTTAIGGEERRLAAGGEAWMLGRRVGLRAGVNLSTIGERRTFGSTGVTLAMTRGLFLDGALIPGADQDRSGWSVSLRTAF